MASIDVDKSSAVYMETEQSTILPVMHDDRKTIAVKQEPHEQVLDLHSPLKLGNYLNLNRT